MREESLEIRFWREEITVSLTPLQTKTLLAILGLNVSPNGYTAFTDETLKKIWDMKENPLKNYDITTYDKEGNPSW